MSKTSILALALLASTGWPPARAQVVISEFLAENRSTLADDAGRFDDWIELYNAGTSSVDLEGWHLTDDARDPTQWRFPAVEIGAGDFLVLFATGDNRVDPASELHTNFRLGAGGDHLGLFDAAGTLVSVFEPEYPEQLPDHSFGHPSTWRSGTRTTTTRTPSSSRTFRSTPTTSCTARTTSTAVSCATRLRTG